MILAAGEATRMGMVKQALPLGKTTMIGSAIGLAAAAGLDPIVVVTGFHQEAVAEAVGDTATLAHNPDPGRGNMSSLIVGTEAIGSADGLILLLSDMPGMEPEVVASFVRAFGASHQKAGWVEYADGRGHPLGFSRSAFPDFDQLSGPKALWPYLSSLSTDETLVVDVDRKRPTDINTPAEYHRATRAVQRGQFP